MNEQNMKDILTYKKKNKSRCGEATPTFTNNNDKMIVDLQNKLITLDNY